MNEHTVFSNYPEEMHGTVLDLLERMEYNKKKRLTDNADGFSDALFDHTHSHFCRLYFRR